LLFYIIHVAYCYILISWWIIRKIPSYPAFVIVNAESGKCLNVQQDASTNNSNSRKKKQDTASSTGKDLTRRSTSWKAMLQSCTTSSSTASPTKWSYINQTLLPIDITLPVDDNRANNNLQLFFYLLQQSQDKKKEGDIYLSTGATEDGDDDDDDERRLKPVLQLPTLIHDKHHVYLETQSYITTSMIIDHVILSYDLIIAKQ